MGDCLCGPTLLACALQSQISKKIIPLSSMKEVISDIREGDTNRFKFRLVTTLRDRTFLFAADSHGEWALHFGKHCVRLASCETGIM